MDIEEVLEFADHLVFAMTGKHLDSLQKAILRGAWECQKYREIAEAHHRSEVYVKEVGFKLWQLLSDILGEAVNKGNFRATLERRWRFSHFLPFWKAFVQKKEILNDRESLDLFKEVDEELLSEAENQSILSLLPAAENIPRQDLGEAPEVSNFYGRTEELNFLENWIVKEGSPRTPQSPLTPLGKGGIESPLTPRTRKNSDSGLPLSKGDGRGINKGGTGSRLVTILGMSGIGKTTLAVKLVEQIKDKFDYVIWRSLRSAPPLESLQQNLRQFLLNYPPYSLFGNRHQSRSHPRNHDSISELIELLRKSRCLVILDDVEMLFSRGKLAGYYRSGYEDYGCLFKQVAELSHQSCFLLISSEAPKEIYELTSTHQSCHSLQVNGLSLAAARELLIQQGLIADENWDKLIEQYQGNPLWLKIVSTTIADLFGGNVGELLDYDPLFLPEDLKCRLQQQCDRLSELEKQTISVLAAESQPLSLAKLRDSLPVAPANLPDAIQSLMRRSLIVKEQPQKITRFKLQPVMRQYLNHSSHQRKRAIAQS